MKELKLSMAQYNHFQIAELSHFQITTPSQLRQVEGALYLSNSGHFPSFLIGINSFFRVNHRVFDALTTPRINHMNHSVGGLNHRRIRILTNR